MPSNDANKTLLRAYAREDFHDKDTDWHSGLGQEEYESLNNKSGKHPTQFNSLSTLLFLTL